ncbi:MAG TPA: hypothetical protein ENN67_04475, partial [Firmicutes bacterium]|nr:hypothetical protein [Bacillota bacterium]
MELLGRDKCMRLQSAYTELAVWFYRIKGTIIRNLEILLNRGAEVDNKTLEKNLLEIIRLASTDLPPDIENALIAGYKRENPGSPAKSAFKTMLSSVNLSRERNLPLCQDTGALVWHISYPDGSELLPVEKAIEKAIAKATDKSYLRPNAVDPIT